MFKQRCYNDRKIWAQSDALRCGIGWDEEDIEKPLILVEDVFGESHPGSTHLNKLAENANIGIYSMVENLLTSTLQMFVMVGLKDMME